MKLADRAVNIAAGPREHATLPVILLNYWIILRWINRDRTSRPGRTSVKSAFCNVCLSATSKDFIEYPFCWTADGLYLVLKDSRKAYMLCSKLNVRPRKCHSTFEAPFTLNRRFIDNIASIGIRGTYRISLIFLIKTEFWGFGNCVGLCLWNKLPLLIDW